MKKAPRGGRVVVVYRALIRRDGKVTIPAAIRNTLNPSARYVIDFEPTARRVKIRMQEDYMAEALKLLHRDFPKILGAEMGEEA